MNAAPTGLPGVPSPTASSRNGWLTSALAALALVASVVAAVLLIAGVADRALYDPYRIGQAGWKLNLAIGSMAVVIAALLVVSGRALSRSQRRAPGGSRHTGAVVAAVLLPGVWLGALTSAPIHAALTAASGSASRPLSDSETSAAVSQVASQVPASAGWTRTGRRCTQGYACWMSPQVGFLTKPSFVALAKEFGIRPESARCDEPILSPNGRGVQDCESGGVTARYEVAVILQVLPGTTGAGGTEIDVAPVRQLT